MCRYSNLTESMDSISLEEVIMAVRRQSRGFSRGTSAYRGVTHHPSGRSSSSPSLCSNQFFVLLPCTLCKHVLHCILNKEIAPTTPAVCFPFHPASVEPALFFAAIYAAIYFDATICCVNCFDTKVAAGASEW